MNATRRLTLFWSLQVRLETEAFLFRLKVADELYPAVRLSPVVLLKYEPFPNGILVPGFAGVTG